MPGVSARQFGHDLRALVLHLEPALLEGRLGLDVGMAAGAVDRRDADAVGRKPRCRRPEPRKLGQDAVAIGLQRVDAQVERRPRRKAGRFRHPFVAESILQQRRAPVRTVGANFGGRVGEPARPGRVQFVLAQRRRCELVAVERRVQPLRRLVPFEQQRTEAQGARRVGIEQPAGRAFPAQRVVDDVADRGAVAGTGEAVGQAPVLQRIRRRPVPPRNVFQHVDGCRQSSAETHGRSNAGLPECRPD